MPNPPSKFKKPLIITLASTAFLALAIFLTWFEFDRRENLRLDAISVTLRDSLTVPYGQEAKVSDFLTELLGEMVDDFTIDTHTLGQHEINFDYINQRNSKRQANFTIEVIDAVAPKIYGSNYYAVPINYEGKLTDLMLSGDDLDDSPAREILGDYNLSKAGTYHLTYSITDHYRNQTMQDFILEVVKPSSAPSRPSPEPEKFPIADAIKTFKTDRTQIGIDVSKWQGEIDWAAVKASGVEFAFIRLGYQYEYEGEYILDPNFEANIKGAEAVGLPVGVYFYSYARSETQAAYQASWILDKIKPYRVELGVAFDWESWGEFNAAGLSFLRFNGVAKSFLDTIQEAGYRGLLYSSKVYLDRIWELKGFPVWLAQYYDRPTYEGEFEYWQFSDSGRVPGINGAVDLDVRYLK